MTHDVTEPARAAPGHATSEARPAQAERRASAGIKGTGRRGDEWRKRLEILVFVTPALALIALFVAWPIITAVRFSVYDWKGFGDLTDFVGLDNYAEVLGDEVFRSAVAHNAVIVVGSILLQLPLGVAIALLLNRRMKGQGLLRTVIFVPYVLAEVIAAVVWLQLLQPQYGFVDALTAQVGLTPPEQGWLGTPDYALWVVLLVLTWKYLGLAVLLFLAGMQGVSEELYEAAQLDGASWWQTQWRITLPLLGPTMRTWAFLSMIGSIQCFDMIWVLTQGGPADATATMATYLIDEGTKRHNYGIAGAASVILFVIAFAMALAYQVLILRRDSRDDTQRYTRAESSLLRALVRTKRKAA